jgi:hypothetical protein
MTFDIVSAIASACTLGACLYGLYKALAPIISSTEEDGYDDTDQ